jgi:hypothetical protein
LPYFTQPFCIEADTCEDGIGAVLKKGGRPIAYMSKALGMLNLGQEIYEKSTFGNLAGS